MIDLILTNHRNIFMKTAVLETGISDYHKMMFSISNQTFPKGPSKSVCYGDLKNFDQKAFSSYIESEMSECSNSFENSFQIFQDTTQLFDPLKKKIIYYKNKTFMTK